MKYTKQTSKKKKQEKVSNETKNCLFERINKIQKPLARLMKKKEGPKQNKKLKAEIQKAIGEYYNQFV